MPQIQTFDPTPVPSQASMMGQAAGSGLAKRLGLAEAEKAALGAEGDPIKLAMAFARASTYAPEIQRSLGQLYEQALQRTYRQGSSDIPPQGGVPPPEVKVTEQEKIVESQPETRQDQTYGSSAEPDKKNIQLKSSQEYLNKSQEEFDLPPPSESQEHLFTGALDPTQWGGGPIPATYSPQQIQQVASEDLSAEKNIISCIKAIIPPPADF